MVGLLSLMSLCLLLLSMASTLAPSFSWLAENKRQLDASSDDGSTDSGDPSSASGTCWSDDGEFDSYLQLGKNFDFYWSVHSDMLRGKLRWPGEGWGALGVNILPRMIGADAIIALPASGVVQRSKLDDYVASSVHNFEDQNIFNTSLEYDGTHSELKFSRPLAAAAADEITIEKSGINHFIWAYDDDSSLSYHKHAGRVSVSLATMGNLTTCATAFTSQKNLLLSSKMIAVHAALMALSWGLIMPLGMLLPAFKETRLHKMTQQVGSAMAVIGMAFIIVYTKEKGKAHFTNTMHSMAGLVLMVLLCLHVIAALCRPPASSEAAGDGPGPTRKRRSWEVAHRAGGAILLVLGLMMIVSGFTTAQAGPAVVTSSACWAMFVLVAVVSIKIRSKGGNGDSSANVAGHLPLEVQLPGAASVSASNKGLKVRQEDSDDEVALVFPEGVSV
mmetsp:Transcript_42555/g.73291  ORF Transcript_42555/g.73291 Transcript_42555/m.73291 type:complete len:446 (-) Transcript_42555:111-1448(-)